MAGDFSVPSHTFFFDGYLDAVGRYYTDDRRLCALTAAVTPSKILERLSIASSTPVEDMVKAFDSDIAKFLHTDSRSRLVFYLIEYFVWYKEFSDICECERIQFTGEDFPHEHIAYRLFIDHTHEVLFLAYWKDKDDMRKTPGKRGSVSDEDSSWLRHLKALGQSQGFLSYAQVNERLPLALVDPEEIEAIVEQLKSSGIRVVPDSPTAGS
jgi:sigma-70-like protein